MRWLLRAVWALNIAACALFVVGGHDVGDEIIKGLLWAALWIQTELSWSYASLARKAGV